MKVEAVTAGYAMQHAKTGKLGRFLKIIGYAIGEVFEYSSIK